MALLHGALGDLDDEIPHSGLRIHLERLVPPPNAALVLFIDANPEDPGLVPGEVEGGRAETGAIGEVQAGAVEAGIGLGEAAVLREGGGEGEIRFGDQGGDREGVGDGFSASVRPARGSLPATNNSRFGDQQ